MPNQIELLGHASVVIRGPRVVYVDPWKLKAGGPEADVILVTHSHHDHCSPEDVGKVSRKGTTVIAPADCVAALGEGIVTMAPGDVKRLEGLTVEAMPAYNLNKEFHPRENGWVGYVVDMDGERIYVAGDTDFTPEMKNVKADCVLVPVGGMYTMDAEEAARAVNAIGADRAIPFHYGDIVGTRTDAERFANLCNAQTEIKL